MKKVKTAVLSLLLLALSTTVFAAAKTVAIVPFKVNAEKDMSFLRDGVYDMLSTRLTKEGEVEVLNRQTVEKALPTTAGPLTEATGRELGRKLAADFVLFGSLTVLGNSISLDAKMVDVAGAKPTMSFFEQSEDAGGIISRISAMAAAVNEKMFGRTTAIAQPAPAAAAAPQPQTAQPAPADPFAHPEKMLKQPSGFGGGSGSPFATSEESAREFSPQFWKSAAFKQLFNGIALGDVDGDGKIETVILTPQSVLIYRKDQERFFQVYEYKESGQGYNIGIDIADINGNGVPEIFVTSLTPTRRGLASFVLEYDGKTYRRIAEGESWYFRVCDLPDRGKVLLGQEPRFGSPYGTGIYEMLWRNGRYEPESPVTVPIALNVLGLTLADVTDSRKESAVAFDRDDHIRVFEAAGKEEWKSSEKYGGSTLNYAADRHRPGRCGKPHLSPHAAAPLQARQRRQNQDPRRQEPRHRRRETRKVQELQRLPVHVPLLGRPRPGRGVAHAQDFRLHPRLCDRRFRQRRAR